METNGYRTSRLQLKESYYYNIILTSFSLFHSTYKKCSTLYIQQIILNITPDPSCMHRFISKQILNYRIYLNRSRTPNSSRMHMRTQLMHGCGHDRKWLNDLLLEAEAWQAALQQGWYRINSSCGYTNEVGFIIIIHQPEARWIHKLI